MRLASERSPEDFIELTLDSSEDPPVVLGRTQPEPRPPQPSPESVRPRRRRPDALTEEDVVEFVVDEITSLIER